MRPVVTELVAGAASGPAAAPGPDVLPKLLVRPACMRTSHARQPIA